MFEERVGKGKDQIRGDIAAIFRINWHGLTEAFVDRSGGM